MPRSVPPRRPPVLLWAPVLATQAWLAATVGYLVLLTAAAWRTVLRGGHRTPLPPVATTRFAVLVPAHQEEALITSTVTSLLAADYPRDRFAVHVVADNCTDRTVELAEAAGAVVHERHDRERPGKGPALAWAVRRLAAAGEVPDAFVLVDADSTVDPAFLRVLDAHMARGEAVVQGHYAVREPGSSWATGLRAAALAGRHYLRPLGRTALGGSCGLFGNGMALRADVLLGRDMSAHLTEDLELQTELLLDGVLVGFAPDAVVTAEMPTTLAASRTQNERWERGRVELARRYVRRLVRRGPAPAVARLDTAADHLVPPFSVLAAATVAGGAAAHVLARVRPAPVTRLAARLGDAAALGQAAYVLSGLRMVRAPRAVYRSLAFAPLLVVWKVALWARVLVAPSRAMWIRTPRNQAGAERRHL